MILLSQLRDAVDECTAPAKPHPANRCAAWSCLFPPSTITRPWTAVYSHLSRSHLLAVPSRLLVSLAVAALLLLHLCPLACSHHLPACTFRNA